MGISSKALRSHGFSTGPQPVGLHKPLPETLSKPVARPALTPIAPVRHELAGTVEAAVGPVREGVVLSVNALSGLASVRETSTHRRFKLSRRFVEAGIFNALRAGTQIRFRDNGHNTIAAVTLTR